METDTRKTELKMLKNFCAKYGTPKLKRLVGMFLEKRSNQEIADDFGVTRQRVHQWQQAFVDVNVQPKPLTKTALEKPRHKWDG